MGPGYSREKSAASRLVLACALSVASLAALAQQPEVQFVRAWQPAARTLDLSELSGFALAPDGTVFVLERDKGALWRISGDSATSVELAGKERPF